MLAVCYLYYLYYLTEKAKRIAEFSIDGKMADMYTYSSATIKEDVTFTVYRDNFEMISSTTETSVGSSKYMYLCTAYMWS